MTWWIVGAALVLFAILGVGAWVAASRPAFWLGFGEIALRAILPKFKRNGAYERMSRRKDRDHH